MNAHADGGLAPHVVVKLGAARIGIPADSVVRALSAPEQYAALPRRHGALLGMLAVDGLPVPVIDIGCWVALAGMPDSGANPELAQTLRRVVLLRDGARLAAVQVDALEPLAALPASAIVRLCHDDDPEQLFHSAALLPDSGETLALLNVANLFELSHSWCEAAGVADAAASEDDASHAAADTAEDTWALVDAFGETLALRADHVAEVTPMPALESFYGGSGVSLCEWRGGHLAVLPLGRLLGSTSTATAPLLAVLRLGELSLGLPINHVRELRQLAADPQGVRTAAAGRLPCVTVSSDDGATIRMVDTEALFAMHPEGALNLSPQSEAASPARRNEETYVVVDAGGKLALPINAFEEVLHAAPEECVSAPDGKGATLNWRGATIPVRDLRQPPLGAARRGKVSLVVLRNDAAPVALAVDHVVSMIPPGGAELQRMQRGGQMVELLILSEDSGSSTYRIADPVSLLRA